MDKVNEGSCATIGLDPQDIYPGECADDSFDMEIINNNDNQDSNEASIPTPLPVYAIIVVTTVFMCEGFAVCYFLLKNFYCCCKSLTKR
jgi:hypothetical protein